MPGFGLDARRNAGKNGGRSEGQIDQFEEGILTNFRQGSGVNRCDRRKTQLGSKLFAVFGVIAVVAVSFGVTLKVLDAIDASRENANPTYSRVVNALWAGETIVIRIDDDPGELRDPAGHVACGPGAGNSPLGTLVPEGEYDLTYKAAASRWVLVGPYRETPMCGTHVESAGPFDDRPEKGEIVLWGAHMTFDQNLDVYDARNTKIGRILRIR